ITIIFIFKYYMFAFENINSLFTVGFKITNIALPIGISFFTFQAISYIVDVYRKDGKAQKSLINVGLYIAFFPQLIAGPIVRYNTIADQIENRRETIDDFVSGFCRFIVGLGKKVLLANSMAIVADYAFNFANEEPLSVSLAWLGAIAYTFQIFFDFSGYSDMAIGLGRMFGFNFLENFNYPYVSKSATEFWRRWHMSLGTWFRDYIYIPLGGSRVKAGRHILNLFIVWLLTGVWHGANWTFVIWGLLYFVLLVFEKYSNFEKTIGKIPVLPNIYAMFFVIMGWVIFRAESLPDAVSYMKAMFSIGEVELVSNGFRLYFRQYAVYIAACIIASVPIIKNLVSGTWSFKSDCSDLRWTADTRPAVIDILFGILLFLIFIVSVSFIVKGSYNPFIYFNF
ncbi:MAG: MBOAT family O-acyltransferase, partial [Anaerovoracaceae bacterium]